jgi:anti-sigma regulatory factor (Ser/Thr protein kinase)
VDAISLTFPQAPGLVEPDTHTQFTHLPPLPICRDRPLCYWLTVMAMAVQTARVAAQLREAAREMARLALRRAQAESGHAGLPGGRATLAEDGTPGTQCGDGRAQAPAPLLAAQPGPDMADLWPLQNFLELGPQASAVPRARRHVRQLLREWNLTESGETAELVVSELLTNAVLATRELGLLAPVRLWLLSDKRSVLILVWDSSPQPPARIAAAGAENGRGLLLVEAISTRWNWYVPHHLGGKVIWAQIGAEPR